MYVGPTLLGRIQRFYKSDLAPSSIHENEISIFISGSAPKACYLLSVLDRQLDKGSSKQTKKNMFKHFLAK